MTDRIKITPLGGVGEVGALNLMVYETEDQALVVDCGSMFPDDDILGVDLIIPDFGYLESIREKLCGLILTHGHEDHIGALPYLLNKFRLPIYSSAITQEFAKSKLEEFSLGYSPKWTVFEPGDDFCVGSFPIETAYVNHSFVDSVALAIGSPGSYAVHLTDWKIDKKAPYGKVTDLEKFEKWGASGVRVLLSDSTCAPRKGSTLSEKEVLKNIKKICSKYQGRIIVTLFSSNLYRIQELATMAKQLGRTLSFVGRSMHGNTAIARKLGHLRDDGCPIIDIEETKKLADEKVLILATGTQGEHRSVLSRIANDAFKPFKIKKGDLVLFSSRTIPGNEKNVSRVIDQLFKLGAQVLYEDSHHIHTSGHAYANEIKTALKCLRPRHLVPIHGEYRHLHKQAELALKWGMKENQVHIIENGQPLYFDGPNIFRDEAVPTGRIFVDGGKAGGTDKAVLRDRRQLAQTGLIVCVIMIDHETGEILREVELISRGLAYAELSQELLDDARSGVMELLSSMMETERTDKNDLQEEVRRFLRRHFNKVIDRKPVVIPVIQEI